MTTHDRKSSRRGIHRRDLGMGNFGGPRKHLTRVAQSGARERSALRQSDRRSQVEAPVRGGISDGFGPSQSNVAKDDDPACIARRQCPHALRASSNDRVVGQFVRRPRDRSKVCVAALRDFHGQTAAPPCSKIAPHARDGSPTPPLPGAIVGRFTTPSFAGEVVTC